MSKGPKHYTHTTHMGLEAYHIVIIVAVIFGLIMFLAVLIKKYRAKHQTIEIRTVSTIQSAYYTPAQYVQYSTDQDSHLNSTASGWNVTNLDAPTTLGINIRQPAVGAIIIPRDPVIHAQNGYSSNYQQPSTIQQQKYKKPPPYNPYYSTNKS